MRLFFIIFRIDVVDAIVRAVDAFTPLRTLDHQNFEFGFNDAQWSVSETEASDS